MKILSKKYFLTVTMFILTLTLVSGCPVTSDPFFIAKTTVAGARFATDMVDLGFATANSTAQKNCNNTLCIKLDPDKGIKYNACMGEDHATDATYQTCYKPMRDVMTIWAKSKDIANSVWKATDAAILLSEKLKAAKVSGDPEQLKKVCEEIDPSKGVEYNNCLQGKKVTATDWYEILKVGACVVAKSLAFVPKEYEKYVKPIIAILERYGCSKISSRLTSQEATQLYSAIKMVATPTS